MPDKKGSDDRAYARGFAAGRAAATPDPPDAADLVAAHLRERWPCTCRPGMDGGGVYHAADCNSRREGSQAVLAVIRLLRAATPPASPDERLREAGGLLSRAKTALRAHRLNWLALSDRLDAPYPDRPDSSPWSRFALPVCQRGKLVEDEIVAALAAADREAPDPSVSPEQEEK